MKIQKQVFVWIYVLISLGKIPRNEMAESHGNGIFKFWKNCQTVFQSECVIFYSQKQCIRVPAVSFPCQYLTLSEFNRCVVVSQCGFNLYYPNNL